jgi:hypothetical protein
VLDSCGSNLHYGLEPIQQPMDNVFGFTRFGAYNHASKSVASQMVCTCAQSRELPQCALVHSILSHRLATVGQTLSYLLTDDVSSWRLKGMPIF